MLCKKCFGDIDVDPTLVDKQPYGCAVTDDGKVRVFQEDSRWNGKPYNSICRVQLCSDRHAKTSTVAKERVGVTSKCELSIATLLGNEKEKMDTFYVAVMTLILLIEVIGGYYVLGKEEIKTNHLWWVAIFGMRSFDMMSDW